MLRGYIWTAGDDSELLYEQQSRALLGAGVVAAQIYKDECPRRELRPQLQHCLEVLQSGDTLVVWRLDRLAHGRAHLLEVLGSLQQRDVGLKVLDGKGAAIDTADISFTVLISVIEALTEMEEQIVQEATLAGLAAARARGQTLGPKRKMTADMILQAMTAMADPNISVTQIASQLGITRATLYNYVGGDGSPKPAGIKVLEEAESSDYESSSEDDINSSSTNC